VTAPGPGPRPVGQDDVAGLEVPVDEAAVVDRGQAFGERRPELAHPCLIVRAAPCDGLGRSYGVSE
jgi:hypothetical protein